MHKLKSLTAEFCKFTHKHPPPFKTGAYYQEQWSKWCDYTQVIKQNKINRNPCARKTNCTLVQKYRCKEGSIIFPDVGGPHPIHVDLNRIKAWLKAWTMVFSRLQIWNRTYITSSPASQVFGLTLEVYCPLPWVWTSQLL